MVRGHAFMASAKKSKIWTPTPPFPLYPQKSNFGLSSPYSWTSLIGIQAPPSTLGNFGIFLETFNNGINIVTYSFFFALANSIYYSHMYIKTNRKANSF